jgi:hypothetical protein
MIASGVYLKEILLPAEVLFMPPTAQYGRIKIEDGSVQRFYQIPWLAAEGEKPVLRIPIGFNADPDPHPVFDLNADPDPG